MMAATTSASVIASKDFGDEAGAVVYWSLSGAVSHEDLEYEWCVMAELESDWLPSEPSKETALKRALEQFREDRRGCLLRPLGKGRSGYVLVHEHFDDVDGGKPSYRNGLSAEILDGKLVVDLGAFTSVDSDAHGEYVEATYKRYLGLLTQNDVSTWLVHLAQRVGAVRLRDSGGIYFVPRDVLDTWRSFVAAIRKVSQHKMFEIPAMRTEEAVNAILDALNAEADAALATLNADLDGWAASEQLKKHVVETRTRRLRDVDAKLTKYEGLLGVKLEALRAQVEQVSARLVAAALEAE